MAREDLRRSQKIPTPQQSGIALFMVIGAISVLSILVTEFVYIAQLNQKLAYDNFDQVKAHYLAKSAVKLSLLRLKAFQTVKGLPGVSGKDSQVPQSLLDKIWSFPFLYPIPTDIPGMTPSEKDAISKFQKGSNLDGHYSALIESESSRLNLNMILAGFVGVPSPSPSVAASPSPQATALAGDPGTTPAPSPNPGGFNVDEARTSLETYLQNTLQHKYDSDPDFQSEYRDFRMSDFMDSLIAWADPSYERKIPPIGGKDQIPMKRGPFYSLTELHMLPGMDDQLYDLWSPTLTVSKTTGININTMQKETLHAIVPQMTNDETTEFFKFRDNTEEDNTFKDTDGFFSYLSNSVNAFQKDSSALNKLKENLTQHNIRLVINETDFKITAVATVNESVKKFEVWVTLYPTKSNTSSSSSKTTPAPAPTATGTIDPNHPPDSGLKINFVRIS